MSEPRIILEPTHYYHVYNHAVGDENLFNNEKDYQYFLTRMKEYILPISDVLAYCLLPNHVHLIVIIKSKKEVIEFLKQHIGDIKVEKGMNSNEYFISDRLSRIFSNFFNTYAKHYNFWRGRTGSLFKRAFMRKPIED